MIQQHLNGTEKLQNKGSGFEEEILKKVNLYALYLVDVFRVLKLKITWHNFNPLTILN